MKKIIQGFKNLAFKKEKVEAFAGARLAKCKMCTHNTANQNRKPPARCNVCGCIISAKVRSPDSSCPKGKWDK